MNQTNEIDALLNAALDARNAKWDRDGARADTQAEEREILRLMRQGAQASTKIFPRVPTSRKEFVKVAKDFGATLYAELDAKRLSESELADAISVKHMLDRIVEIDTAFGYNSVGTREFERVIHRYADEVSRQAHYNSDKARFARSVAFVKLVA